MLSRIADSLFWLNRYMERVDGLLRIVRTHYISSLDKGTTPRFSWRPVLDLFVDDRHRTSSLQHYTDAALYHLLLDTDNINSVKVLILRARENARGVQDHITKEVWENVNQLYHMMHHPSTHNKITSNKAIEEIDYLTKHMLSYTGVVETTMPRGLEWSFMNLGKLVERSLITIEITNKYYEAIDYSLSDQKDILHWRSLLLSLSGYELHLKHYRTMNYTRNVLHQAVFNEEFSRSLLFSLKHLELHLNDVVFKNNNAENLSLARNFGRLYSYVRYTDFDALDHHTLPPFFFETRSKINEFSKQLGKNFFSYS